MVEWVQNKDIDDVTNDMANAYSAQYSNKDRYRDFVNVFRKSQTGLRVLHQILEWGNVYGSTIPRGLGPLDPNRVLINEGERRLALKILSTINVEPLAPPTNTATNKERKNG